jgi:hypothetical protein
LFLGLSNSRFIWLIFKLRGLKEIKSPIQVIIVSLRPCLVTGDSIPIEWFLRTFIQCRNRSRHGTTHFGRTERSLNLVQSLPIFLI